LEPDEYSDPLLPESGDDLFARPVPLPPGLQPLQVPEFHVRFRYDTWDGVKDLTFPNRHYPELEVPETLTHIPLFLFFCFLVKLGHSVVAGRLTPRAKDTGQTIVFDWWSQLYCSTCGRRLYTAYLSDVWPYVKLTCTSFCQCGHDFRCVEPEDGGRYFYLDLGDAHVQLTEAHEFANKRAYVKNDNFRYFAKWNRQKHRQGDEMAKWWFLTHAYSRSAQQAAGQLAQHANNMDSFIRSLDGFVKVIVDDPNDTGKPRTPYFFQGQDILALIWIPPWALDAYRNATYLQLDCSFKATRPFAYCVPQALIKNQAVPLGFVMAPHESGFAYTSFMNEFWGLMEAEHAKHPILSDQHKALDAFCTHAGVKHFYCHCHLVRKWGAGSTLGILCSQVLRVQTKEEFEARRQQWINDLPALVDQHLCDQDHADLFREWLEKFSDGMWDRIELGIARCSNHAERFHGIVNAAIKKSGYKALHARLAVLRDVIELRHRSYGHDWSRQVETALDALKNLKNVHSCEECHDHDCEVYRLMMSRRFGFDDYDWPCRHTVKFYHVHAPNLPKLHPSADAARFAPFHDHPQVVLKRDVLAAMPAGEQRDQCANVLKPHDADEVLPPRSTVVVEWADDDTGPREHVDGERHGVPCYAVVREIASGVISLRANKKRLPRIDNAGSFGVIFVHFREAFRAAGFQAEEDTDARRVWLAKYKAIWWHFAVTNRDCPAPTGLPLLGATAVPDPVSPDGPLLRIVVE
jgi:hypothetical protein